VGTGFRSWEPALGPDHPILEKQCLHSHITSLAAEVMASHVSLVADKSFHPSHDAMSAMDDDKPHHDSRSKDCDEKPSLDPQTRKHPSWSMLPSKVPSSLQWIPDNFTLSKIKPVIRCSVAAWVSSILFVIPKVEVWIGQVCIGISLLLRPLILCLFRLVSLFSLVSYTSSRIRVWLLTYTQSKAAFLSPPSDPFPAVLEREILLMFFVTTAWA
jgi:Putative ER transporter, 6TM, N-terminal